MRSWRDSLLPPGLFSLLYPTNVFSCLISVNTLWAIKTPRLLISIQKKQHVWIRKQKLSTLKAKHDNQNFRIRICEEETILLYFLHLILKNLDQKSWSISQKCIILAKTCSCINHTRPWQYNQAAPLKHSSRLQAHTKWLKKTTATTEQNSPNGHLQKEKPLRGTHLQEIHLLEANTQLLTPGGLSQPTNSHLDLC